MALEFAVGFVAQVAGDQSREERGFDERDHMAHVYVIAVYHASGLTNKLSRGQAA